MLLEQSERFFNKKLIFLLILALYLHPIMFSKYRTITYLYYYVFPLIFFLFKIIFIKNLLFTLSKKYLQFIYIQVILIIIITIGSLLVPILYKTGDFSFFLNHILAIYKELYKYFFIFVLYITFFPKNGNTKQFITFFILANCIYVFGTFLICLIPDLRNFIIDNIYMSEVARLKIVEAQYFTRIGWMGFTGFLATFMCSIYAIISMFFLLKSVNLKERIIYNSTLLISIIGNIFYGRTGMFITFICLFFYLFLVYFNNKKNFYSYLVSIIFLIFIGLILCLISEKVKVSLGWSFAQIVALFKTGSPVTPTVTSLINMYKIPNLKTFFLGDGYYTVNGLYYMQTDVGWLRPIFFYGISFSILGFILIFIQFYMMYKSKLKDNPISFYFLLLSFMFTYILFESKGEIYNYFYPLLFIFGLAYSYFQCNLKLKTRMSS